MHCQPLALPGLMLFTPSRYADERGFFLETFRQQDFVEHCGAYQLVQDNLSRSSQGVLRGLHYQWQRPQGKLIRVNSGEVFDVVVDLRRNSPTFGKWLRAVFACQSNISSYGSRLVLPMAFMSVRHRPKCSINVPIIIYLAMNIVSTGRNLHWQLPGLVRVSNRCYRPKINKVNYWLTVQSLTDFGAIDKGMTPG